MIPLTVRSHYSLMWGTAPVKALCRAARRLGYRRLALTDTDNLYGLWDFLADCRREGLAPVVGAEITDPRSRHRAVCLVKNGRGYRNLCRLLTRRHTDAAFSLDGAVPRFSRGLVVLTGSAQLLSDWHGAGVDVAAALPRRPVPAGHRLCLAARRCGRPLVATPGSFFLTPDDAAFHRLLRAISKNTSLSRLDPADTAPTDAWLATAEEYRRRFAVCPEAVDNTVRLAERLTFTGPPQTVVMPTLEGKTDVQADALLRREALRGARRRYGPHPDRVVTERLAYELEIIARMRFSAYFLVVRDIVRRSPRTCGRGSGAASLVAYCLGITNVCPLRYNLYFERFLNPGRSDPPDIDVDFAWDERDSVLNSVLRQYAGRAAMVASHIHFQPRMAVRETAKVYGLTKAEIDRVTRRLSGRHHGAAKGDLQERLRQQPGAGELDLAAPWPQILQLARRLAGTPRHLSVHPGGVVITPRPVDSYVPVEQAPKGVPVIQWDKEAAEAAGLVKIDLLGNRSLGVIRDTLAAVRASGVVPDEYCWVPEEDRATRRALARGQTMGCFYIESPAMRLLQQKAGTGDFEHLVIHSSIIRPAANEFIREYLRRLHGGRWKPIHPLLEDVLDETYGVMVYQEDVSRAAVAVAGFSHVEADGLRKVLSKKDRATRLRDYYARFVAGARRRGLGRDQIEAVWAMMMSFDGYSFCKPHSASYARVSCQAAYLKVHHPAEFMAAVLSNQGGFYSAFAYVSEARRMGLRVLPPDVNASRIHWSGVRNHLRVGLMAVRGLSRQTMARITARRKERSYTGIDDLIRRAAPERDELRALVAAGALDSLNPSDSRAALLWGAVRPGACRRPEQRQRKLFHVPPTTPRLPADDPGEQLRREFEVLGFLCEGHPMALYRCIPAAGRAVRAVDLPRLAGKRVRFAGWLITGKVVRTRSDETMQFLTFEDETGLVEATFFPRVYRRCCHRLDTGRPCLLTGRVEEEWGAVTLTVTDAAPLTEVRQQRGDRAR